MLLPDANTIAMLEERFGMAWTDSAGEEIHVLCPFCVKRGHSPDKSGHLAINLGKNMAHCVRCDWGTRGASEWLGKRGMQVQSLQSAMMSLDGMHATLRGTVPPPSLVKQSLRIPQGFDYFGTGDDELFFMGHYLKSMQDKCIDLATLTRHRIGYCMEGWNAGYVIFPFWEGSDLVYWQGRAALPSLLADPKKKKLNPSKKDAPLGKGSWFYGYGNAQKGGKAVLVEGPLDRITVHDHVQKTYGEHAFCLSVQGHTVSFPTEHQHPLNSQIGQLLALEPSEVVVLFDPDVEEASKHLAKLLQVAGLNAYPGYLPSGDPNDFHNNPDVLSRATSVLDECTLLTQRILNTKF